MPIRNDALLALLLESRRLIKRRYFSFLKKKGHELSSSTYQETKGYEFEKFVVSLFNPEYFTLLEWRSDKFTNDIYPLSCQFPDLEFYFESQTENLHFAVECKWRQYFTRDCVTWTKESQLENYKQFESVTKIPVFIILGVGGSPSKPNEVYSIPLKEINDINLHCITLKPFMCKLTSNRLFLNCTKPSLT